jgi:hypothetical protein
MTRRWLQKQRRQTMKIGDSLVFHRVTRPAQMGASEISQFLTWLAVDRRVSASTQNQALSALLFLYKEVLAIEIAAIPPVVRAEPLNGCPSCSAGRRSARS